MGRTKFGKEIGACALVHAVNEQTARFISHVLLSYAFGRLVSGRPMGLPRLGPRSPGVLVRACEFGKEVGAGAYVVAVDEESAGVVDQVLLAGRFG